MKKKYMVVRVLNPTDKETVARFNYQWTAALTIWFLDLFDNNDDYYYILGHETSSGINYH